MNEGIFQAHVKSNQSRGCGRVTTRNVNTAIGTLAMLRSSWYTSILLHQETLTQEIVDTKVFTQEAFYIEAIRTKERLHQNILRQITFRTECVYFLKDFTPKNSYTSLTPNAFIPDYFYNRTCLHQKPIAPKNFYTRTPSTRGTLCTKELLHQAFTEGERETKRREREKLILYWATCASEM